MNIPKSDLPHLVVANGIDLVVISRVSKMLDRWGDRFLNRFFTETEQAQCRRRVERLAGLVAIKEATSKALGTGLRGVGWREMEVIHLRTGRPTLQLHGRALARSEALGWYSVSVSMTHDGGIAAAVVTALGQREEP